MALPAALEGKLRIPLIGAPMYIVSHPALVIAQCKAGIVGSFPCRAATFRECPALRHATACLAKRTGKDRGSLR